MLSLHHIRRIRIWQHILIGSSCVSNKIVPIKGRFKHIHFFGAYLAISNHLVTLWFGVYLAISNHLVTFVSGVNDLSKNFCSMPTNHLVSECERQGFPCAWMQSLTFWVLGSMNFPKIFVLKKLHGANIMHWFLSDPHRHRLNIVEAAIQCFAVTF